MTSPIRYTILPARPEAHLYRVTCSVAEPDSAGQRFALPAWNPGSYMIREFARHVVSIRAESRGRAVAIEKLDHPVELGEFTLASFRAGGVPHDIVITGRHAADTRRLPRDLRRLCEHHIRFFGKPAPMKRYVFLVTAVGEGYGGLEHRASTALLCSREDLPREGMIEVSERYRTFLGLVSHEYFHTWNVKRIKPATFVRYDLDRENYT